MQPRDQLTTKEIQVTTLVWEGLTNREIAKIVGTTEQVIKNYLRTAFDELGVWSRLLELALYVASHGGADWPAQRTAVMEGGMASSADENSVALAR
jgi:DNA-binding NarL/FixJ family response regulator